MIVVVVAAKKPKSRYPGIPSILDTILRDATIYFLVMFFLQVTSDVFVFFDHVGVYGTSTSGHPYLAHRMHIFRNRSRTQLGCKFRFSEQKERFNDRCHLGFPAPTQFSFR